MSASSINPDTPIVIKVAIDGNNRKFRLPLRDLNATALPAKLRSMLLIPEGEPELILERFSDSSGAYVTVTPSNPSTYKQLYRAAKAKLKLRLKATRVVSETSSNSDLPEAENIVVSSNEQVNIAFPIRTLESTPSQPSTAGKGTDLLSDAVTVSSNIGTTSPITDIPSLPPTCWQVFCNICEKVLSDAHFHCSICDKGDYDLCEACVDAGNLCHDQDHWLIKRYIQNGKVINSITEKVAPKTHCSQEKEPNIPGNFNIEGNTPIVAALCHRTCNGCVKVLPAHEFLTCTDCEDFDLCISCHSTNKHGHHPGHSFEAAVNGTNLSAEVAARCAAGRNVRHFAICDGCDESVLGVRHKCLDCPDWDYCHTCYKTSSSNHPGHRFVPIYDTIDGNSQTRHACHFGIFCDGPLCNGKENQSYIRGVRFKCAICHDTDFCANCEAHPSNTHNVTHPLIKLKTAVRGVSIQTTGDDGLGQIHPSMGDKLHGDKKATNIVAASNSAAVNLAVRNSSTANLLEASPTTPAHDTPTTFNNEILRADFVRDAVADGSMLVPNESFYQSWVLRNPGPLVWPAGCRLVNTGGDDLLCVDRSQPVSLGQTPQARESKTILNTVQPGEEKTFVLKFRAPAREGRHVSYWRLKTASGLAFGDKLWCDINVKSSTATSASSTELSSHLQTHWRYGLSDVPGGSPFTRVASQSSHVRTSRTLMRPEGRQHSDAQQMSSHSGLQARQAAAAAAADRAWKNAPSIEPLVTQAERLLQKDTKSSIASQETEDKLVEEAFGQASHVENAKCASTSDLPSQEKLKLEDFPNQELRGRQGLRAILREGDPRRSSMTVPSAKDKLDIEPFTDFQRQRLETHRLSSTPVAPHAMQTPALQSAAQNASSAYALLPQPQRAWRQQRVMLQQQLVRNQLGVPAMKKNLSGQGSMCTAPAAPGIGQPGENQTQQLHPELQNKRRLMLSPNGQHTRQGYQFHTTPSPKPETSAALADFQMQMMLLEQQNRRRLMVSSPLPADETAEKIGGTSAIHFEVAPTGTAAPTTTEIAEGSVISTGSGVQLPKPASIKVDGEAVEVLAEANGSPMVFPKLDKESPSSSTQLDRTTETIQSSAGPAVSIVADLDEFLGRPQSAAETESTGFSEALEHDAFEDVDTIDTEDAGSVVDDESDDGFDTDDYDILDASDEEFAGNGKTGL